MRSVFLAVSLFFLSLSTNPALSQTSQLAIPPVQVTVGNAAVLDPTDGFKSTAYVALRVEWSWEQRPPLSVADFVDATALRASFTPDIDGTYVALARFYNVADSAGATVLHEVRVVAGTANLPPVARIRGRSIPGSTGPFGLDATGSLDVNGDALT